MKDLAMAQTPQELASAAEDAFTELATVLRTVRTDHIGDLDKDGQRSFRRLCRQFARFHADAGEFVDEYAPEITTRSNT